MKILVTVFSQWLLIKRRNSNDSRRYHADLYIPLLKAQSSILYATFQSLGINLIDLPKETTQKERTRIQVVKASNTYPPAKSKTSNPLRRHWPMTKGLESKELRVGVKEDEKDINLKNKISSLVLQTLHDTEGKIKSVQHLKDKYKDRAPYKAGFVLSMVKKTRDVLNELFNLAVKHRDEWKALEQLKIFELIVHTNVDTTNLVRQLVEIHIQNLNTTSDTDTRRVVLM